jgi:hypothetical protein
MLRLGSIVTAGTIVVTLQVPLAQRYLCFKSSQERHVSANATPLHMLAARFGMQTVKNTSMHNVQGLACRLSRMLACTMHKGNAVDIVFLALIIRG